MAQAFGKPFVIGGHRGCGENLYSKELAAAGKAACSGVRENTIASFCQAAEAKVDFVEFDVQVTADGVPVIFHDDYVVHGDLWSPRRSLVSQLSASQLRSLPALLRRFKDAREIAWLPFDCPWQCEREDLMAVPTLQEAFDKVPAEIGFNIEVKMASTASSPATPAQEISRVVDPILTIAAGSDSGRSFILSSFDPDVMAYVASQPAAKADTVAGLFLLTSGGREAFHGDPRRRSVPAASQFALQVGLKGLVVDSGSAKDHADDISAAITQGLQVMTYGMENNDAEWVVEQKRLGFVGAIADDVFTIVTCVAQA